MSGPHCWWTVDALAERPPADPVLQGDDAADVCIAGGGYAGLWTAIHLKERRPELDVVVVERGVCGLGASGRNAGFAMSWWSKFPTLAKTVGDEAALRLCRRSAEVVELLGDFCEREGIDADYAHSGWLWAATSEAQLGAWQSTIDKLAAHGERPFRVLGKAEAVERTGSDAFFGGAVEASVATVQPAVLARGLRDVAVRRGVRIFEHTPMTGLRHGAPHVVATPGGSVTAPTVVLALNAWIARMRALRRRLVVISTDAIVTEPIPDRLPPAVADGMGVTDARRLLNAFRRTRDGRVYMCRSGGSLTYGGRLGDRYEGTSPRVEELREHLHRTFPALEGVRLETSWRGPIDYSVTGLPFIGALSTPGLYTAAGFSGNGLGPAYLAGESLAAQILGGEDVLEGSALTRPQARRLPPEPVRYAGGRIVRAAIARKEAAEDRDRRPDPVTALFAGMDPTSTMDRGPSQSRS
jgi:glycine/D-amino acid oxidase-like deaminating enzyme